MEKLVNSYDIEFMKMAMLKHEETFKQQVYELHRLYRVQKIMMKNMETDGSDCRYHEELKDSKKNLNYNSVNQSSRLLMKLDLKTRADEYIAESNGDGDDDEEDEDHGDRLDKNNINESEIELTLGPTCYHDDHRSNNHRKKTTTSSSPLNSDTAPSFSSSSTGSSQFLNQTKNGVYGVAKEDRGGRGRRQKIGDGGGINEEQLRKDRLRQQQPPWIYQVLSLKMT